jgi:hypothetical protein
VIVKRSIVKKHHQGIEIDLGRARRVAKPHRVHQRAPLAVARHPRREAAHRRVRAAARRRRVVADGVLRVRPVVVQVVAVRVHPRVVYIVIQRVQRRVRQQPGARAVVERRRAVRPWR